MKPNQMLIIDDLESFHGAVDLIARNRAEIHRLTAFNKDALAMAEAYALANRDEVFTLSRTKGETDQSVYAISRADHALRRQNDFSEDDVVRLLGDDEEAKIFIRKTYDSSAIKTAFGRTATARKAVRKFGLYFTEPKDHLEVAAK